MTSGALTNPAGGLRYHWRAFRHGSELWQPFRWALGEWLLAWEPPETTLVLVGPSGGYTVQPFLFERFERVVCLEPDPLAKLVFRRRLAAAPLERRPLLDFISDDRLVSHPERLPELLESLGDTAVLFSNVLGQLRVLLDVSSSEAPGLLRIKEEVRRAITGRSWASFHDRVSGRVRPEFNQPLIAEGRLTDPEVISILYSGDGVTVESDPNLLDHLTEGLFPEDLSYAYFTWELAPGWFHLIEGVRAVREKTELTEARP